MSTARMARTNTSASIQRNKAWQMQRCWARKSSRLQTIETRPHKRTHYAFKRRSDHFLHDNTLDALVIGCSWNTNVIQIWAWMLWSQAWTNRTNPCVLRSAEEARNPSTSTKTREITRRSEHASLTIQVSTLCFGRTLRSQLLLSFLSSK